MVMVMLMVVMMFVFVFVLFLFSFVSSKSFLQQFLCQRLPLLHNSKNLYAGQFIPRSRDYLCLCILLLNQAYRSLQLILIHSLRPAQNDGICALNLIVIELAEVLHIHTALICIRNGYEIIQLNVDLIRCLCNGSNNI